MSVRERQEVQEMLRADAVIISFRMTGFLNVCAIPFMNHCPSVESGERARGFLEAATLSEAWVREMGCRGLDLEGLCPEVNRRSLQRDLKAMVDRGLISPRMKPINCSTAWRKGINLCGQVCDNVPTRLRHPLRQGALALWREM